jgi:hypothetical protein
MTEERFENKLENEESMKERIIRVLRETSNLGMSSVQPYEHGALIVKMMDGSEFTVVVEQTGGKQGDVTDVPFTEGEVITIRTLMRANEIEENPNIGYRLHPTSENEYNQLDLPGGFAIQKLSNGFFNVSAWRDVGGTYDTPPSDDTIFEDERSTSIDKALMLYFAKFMEMKTESLLESIALHREFEEDKARHLEDH